MENESQRVGMLFGGLNTPTGPALAMQPWGCWNQHERVVTMHPSLALRQREGKKKRITTIAKERKP